MTENKEAPMCPYPAHICADTEDALLRERDELRKENETLKAGLDNTSYTVGFLDGKDSLRSVCESLMGALEWYSDEENYTSDDEGIHVASAWHGNRLGEKAKEAVTAARKALGEK